MIQAATLCILSQLFVEVNRSGSGSAFAPNLVAYTGGAVQAALPTDQQQWVRLYQQESTIHQLTARKTQRLSGAVDAGFDVAPKSLPCSQVPAARHHLNGTRRAHRPRAARVGFTAPLLRAVTLIPYPRRRCISTARVALASPC